MRKSTIPRIHTMAALGLLLLVGVHGTTIISIKYPEKPTEVIVDPQPAKRDLSLSYAATNIDSKEGTRVKTITVIKNVGGISANEEAAALGSPVVTASRKQQPKLIIDPSLHKSEEWATAFRDNFDSYGSLPDVPDIDDLFEFVNRKKPEGEKKETVVPSQKEVKVEVPKELAKPAAEETTTKKATAAAEASEQSEQGGGGISTSGNIDSDEAVVEKIKGDAELLPHIKQANILRLQAAQAQVRSGIRTKESLIAVNYSTPMHQVSQYFDNYVQAVPNGYDYSKPCNANGLTPGNSIQVTTPSGRHYDIPQSNSSGTGGGNHPYLAPSLTKKTQITPEPPIQQPQQPAPNFSSSVNSIVPPIVRQQPPLGNANPPQQPQQPQVVTPPPPSGGILPPLGTGGISTSQRPYVAPRLRNNGLGISRAPSSNPGSPVQFPGQAGLVGNNNPTQQTPNFRPGNFGAAPNRPNTLRSRGLKY